MKWQSLGFETQKHYLLRAFEEGQLAHAYLFYGQEMIGKKTLALEFAFKINDLAPAAAASHFAVKVIEPQNESNSGSISIDQVRDAKHFLSTTAFASRFNVLIINDAQRFTEEAQNALLKILEEPPKSALIFVITSHLDHMLPTIISRCQTVFFPSHDVGLINSFLAESDLKDSQQKFIAQFANGRLGLVREFLREGVGGKIKEDIGQLDMLTRSDTNHRLAWASQAAELPRLEIKKTLLTWLLYLRMKGIFKPASKLLKGYEALDRNELNLELLLDAFVMSL